MSKIALWLTLAIVPVWGQTTHDAAATAERAQWLLKQVYMRPEVARYCMRNPDGLYQIELYEVTLVVRCPSWHDWRKQQAEG